MKEKIALKIILLSLITYANGAYITELTDNNFFDYAKDKDFLLTEFYAPWCSDCQKLAPEIEKAADTLGTRSADIARVDCFGAGSGLCQMYGVRSWPQLKTFRRGTYASDYTGAQTGDAIAMYIETMAGADSPVTSPVVNAAEQVQNAPLPAPAQAPASVSGGQPAADLAPAVDHANAPAASPAVASAVAPAVAPAAAPAQVAPPKNQKAETTTGDKTINHAKAIIHSHKHKAKKRGGGTFSGKLKRVETHTSDPSSATESHVDIIKISQYKKKKKQKRLNQRKILLF